MSYSLLRAARGVALVSLLVACESDPVSVPDSGAGQRPGDNTDHDNVWGDGWDEADSGQGGWGGNNPSDPAPDASSGDGDDGPFQPPADAGSGGRDAGTGGGIRDAGDDSSGNNGGDAEPPPPPPPVSFTDPSRCNDPNLVWRTGSRTTYESYPEWGSEECVEFSGCDYMGRFAACRQKKSEEWVASHNIAAVFPNFGDLRLHDLCLRQGNEVLVVTVYDTCGDHDCDGCCTRNKGNKDQLIDLEVHTDARWNARGRDIEWADLGPTQGGGCEESSGGGGGGGRGGR